MLNQKNIAVSIILTIVTCGIYGIYWFVTLTNDVKQASGDTKLATGGVAFLLTLVTCGIYGIYWAYQIGKLMSIAKEKNGFAADDNSVLYLILEILSLNIVVCGLVQNDLNNIIEKNSTVTTGVNVKLFCRFLTNLI